MILSSCCSCWILISNASLDDISVPVVAWSFDDIFFISAAILFRTVMNLDSELAMDFSTSWAAATVFLPTSDSGMM
jgi:hypothetical protein